MKTLYIFLIILLEIMFVKQLFPQAIQNENKIYFHDFIPDTLLRYQVDTLKIDINQDCISDIAFYLVFTSGGTYCYLKSINPDCQYAFFPDDYCLDLLTCDSLRWRTIQSAWIEYDNHKKLALRFSINNQYYYGWLRGYQIYSDTFSFFVDQYAFCPIPGYPLLWGQTVLTDVNDIGTAPLAWAFYDPVVDQLSIHAVKKNQTGKTGYNERYCRSHLKKYKCLHGCIQYIGFASRCLFGPAHFLRRKYLYA